MAKQTTYTLGPVQPHVKAAAYALGRMFAIGSIGGFATSGHITDSDHYKGLALDFMCDIPTGNRLAAYAQAHASEYNITYIIHNRKIWSVARASEGWRPYSGSSPHTDHVHISFAAKGANPVPSGQASPAVATGVSLPNPLAPVNAIVDFLSTPGLWLRVLMFVGGVILGLLATGSLAIAQLAIKKVGST